MHFHLQTLHRTTTRLSKYSVNSIVRLLLKLCPLKNKSQHPILKNLLVAKERIVNHCFLLHQN